MDRFSVAGYRTRPLSSGDEALIQRLSERCSDYIDIVEGQPVGPQAGREFLNAAPPNRQPESLLKVGLFSDHDELVGILEAAPDFPAEGVWHLGLLLLDPAVRGAGLGRRVYAAFEQHAREHGARTIRLSVVAVNEAAFRFWHALGFQDVETHPPEIMGRKRQSVTVLEKSASA